MVKAGQRSGVRTLSLVFCLLLPAVLGDDSFFFDSHLGVCERRWEKVYTHDHTGTAVFGRRESLATAVISGDIIRVVIHSIPQFQVQTQTTTYILQADNAILSRDQVCVEALSLYNHFNAHFQEHAQGDTLWHVLLCADTGNLHVLGVQLDTQRVISDCHVNASATWYVRSWAVREHSRCWSGGRSQAEDEGCGSRAFCEWRASRQFWPVYSHYTTGTPVGRKRISALLEAVKRGQDVRASMRDRGYSFPMHTVHWSEEEAWVGGYSVLYVGQRLFPSHVGMRTERPYLWISSWSTSGRRQNTRWALHSHVSQGANQDTVSLDWVTDPCWRHVYTNDASGLALRGSLEELLASVHSGHRVRLVVEGVATEADVIRIRGGQVAAQLLSQLASVASSRERHHLLHDIARWKWRVVHTTGTIRQYEVLLNNHTRVSYTTNYSTVSWFVDTRPWALFLSLANQNVTTGHVTALTDAVHQGASVRLKFHHTSHNGDTFAPAGNLQVVTTNTGVQVTSAQILRYLGDEEVGDSEVRLQGQLIWWMSTIDTRGVMTFAAWDTSHKMKYFDITLTPEIDWFVNK